MIPFLIPFFPNNLYFLRILFFLKKNKIKNIEIGIPNYNCYKDGIIIKKSYIKIIRKFNFVKLLKIINLIKYFKIIFVFYYDSFMQIKKKYLKKYKYIVIDNNIGNIKLKKFNKNCKSFCYMMCSNCTGKFNIKIKQTKNISNAILGFGINYKIFKKIRKYNKKVKLVIGSYLLKPFLKNKKKGFKFFKKTILKCKKLK
ncbi:hypothetical protein ACT2CI_00305 [Candidatus Vidania fulgoroideorum]